MSAAEIGVIRVPTAQRPRGERGGFSWSTTTRTLPTRLLLAHVRGPRDSGHVQRQGGVGANRVLPARGWLLDEQSGDPPPTPLYRGREVIRAAYAAPRSVAQPVDHQLHTVCLVDRKRKTPVDAGVFLLGRACYRQRRRAPTKPSNAMPRSPSVAGSGSGMGLHPVAPIVHTPEMRGCLKSSNPNVPVNAGSAVT